MRPGRRGGAKPKSKKRGKVPARAAADAAAGQVPRQDLRQRAQAPQAPGQGLFLQQPRLRLGHGHQRYAAGFAKWSRAQRAKGDKFGYFFALVFHLAMLTKYGTLPASYTSYYSLCTATMLCLLAWQRSGRPSYAAWRDWVQAAIRLDVFFSPVRTSLWERSMDVGPPAMPVPPQLSALASVPVALASSSILHMLLLPFAHSLGLWPHLVVQLCCGARLAAGAYVPRLCQQRLFRHPTTQGLFGVAYWWLNGLTLLSVRALDPPQPGGQGRSEQHCQALLLWLLVVVGVAGSLAAQALLDARLYKRFLQERQQRQQQQQQGPEGAQEEEVANAGIWGTLAGLHDNLYDSLCERLLLRLADTCLQPWLWLALMVAAWDAIAVFL